MITDTEARRIADAWHGGGGTALYAFASTGAIDTARADHDIKKEITNEIRDTTSYEELNPMTDLRNLLGYVTYHKARGPVPGWNNLTRQSPRKETTMNPKWEGMTGGLIPQATAWRNALVDGSHHQGRERLRLNDGGMCCLGVLCDTLDPSRWTTFQGVWYWGPDDVFSSPETMKTFGLTKTGTRMDGEFWTINGTKFPSLSFANDTTGITHAHIADALTEYFGIDPYVAAEDQ